MNSKHFIDEVLCQKHIANAHKYFNNLTKTNHTNISANQKAMNSLKKLLDQEKEEVALLSKRKIEEIISFIVISLSLLASIFFFIDMFCKKLVKLYISIPLAILLLLGSGTLLFFTLYKLSPKIHNHKEILARLKREQEEKKTIGYHELASLHNSYREEMPLEITNMDKSFISLENIMDVKTYSLLKNEYNFQNKEDSSYSLITLISGKLNDNYFLDEIRKVPTLISQTYTAEKEIEYEEKVIDSVGKTHIVKRKEKLIAKTKKDVPSFREERTLLYFHSYLPSLSFTRYPHEKNKNIKKMIKNINKNERFKDLFNLKNVSDEKLFNRLYDQESKSNMISFLEKNDHYIIKKEEKIYSIIDLKENHFPYTFIPHQYRHFDYRQTLDMFLNYNRDFIHQLYSDLLPIIINKNLMNKEKMEHNFNNIKSRISPLEAEVIANKIKIEYYLEPGWLKEAILKVRFSSRVGSADKFIVTAYGYKKIKKVENVKMTGKNKKNYIIPVEYFEYQPVKKTSYLLIQKHDILPNTFESRIKENYYQAFLRNNSLYYSRAFYKGYFAFLLKDKDQEYDSNALDKLK